VRSSAAAPRVLAIAAVIALHVGVAVVLVAEMPARFAREDEAGTTPMLVWFLEPRATSSPPPATRPEPRTTVSRTALPRPVERVVPEPITPPPPSSSIDWAAEATAAAGSELDAEKEHARQAQALTPKKSPMFAAAAKRHQFGWDHAATHRVEPIGGLATVINLSDRCGVVLFIIIPFAAGCALDKPQARGDLFDHMHDSEP